ncbi:GYD domain-containing protein [Microvirga sp. 2TAF3]|uniref:GYD domain-containing protein n=1 Tax=Microvirga sp. 2TAF3 TaxID=3233014 RepID=UPI003F9AAE0C
MPLFITQGRFTSNAIKGMLAKPEDRSEMVGQLFAKLGGKLLAYYFTFGESDFLVISEGPIESAASAVIVAAAGGGVTDLKTTLAMTAAEMKEAFAKAGTMAGGFRSAGAPER